MKTFLLTILTVSTTLFAAFDTQINPKHVVQIDLNKSKVSLWISYPGELSNVCGIKIKSATFLIGSEDLLENLEIDKGKLVAGKDSLVEAKLFSGPTTLYGAYVLLKTKSGQTFEEVMSEIIASKTTMPESYSRLLVAEALLCK